MKSNLQFASCKLTPNPNPADSAGPADAAFAAMAELATMPLQKQLITLHPRFLPVAKQPLPQHALTQDGEGSG